MRNLCIDPLNPCMSLGAMYAALGVHRCMPLSHGASGCCRFQRMEIARHFDRVVHVPSTMLNDRSAAYGGEAELDEAVEIIFNLYDPQLILAFTTCLSETIGDDMRGICQRLDLPEGKRVIWASTPSYAGSHLAGYDAALAALIDQLAEPAGAGDRSNGLLLVPGLMNPSDIDEIARLAAAFFPKTTVFPDTRDVLDVQAPLNAGEYPDGGTPMQQIQQVGRLSAGVFVGHEATDKTSQAFGRIAGDASVCRVGLPVGLTATDVLVDALVRLSGAAQAPGWICAQRSKAVDAVLQQADLLYGKKVLIASDADMDIALSSFARDVGMQVACVAVGDCDPSFPDRLEQLVPAQKCMVFAHADRHDVEEFLADNPVDLIIGDSRNKRLAAQFGAPLVRVGFPITDRPLSFVDSFLGYTGTLRLLRECARAVIDADEQGKPAYQLAIARYF